MPVNDNYVQFSVRLTKREYEALQRRVEDVNEAFEASGSPGVVSLSRLASFWIVEKLADALKQDEEDRPATKQTKDAKHLNKARAVLRGQRT